MLSLLALVLPPVAVALSGQRRALPVNLLLTLCLFLPGVVHALMVVHRAAYAARAERLASVVLAQEDRQRRLRRRHRVAHEAA